MSPKYAITVPFLKSGIRPSDLEEIGQRIKTIDPSLLMRWFTSQVSPPHWLGAKPKIPTMFWEFHDFTRRTWDMHDAPLRANTNVHKAKQLQLLEKQDVAVPAWTRLTKDIDLPKDVFGEFVLVKSTEARASLGMGITLYDRQYVLDNCVELAREFDGVGRSAPIVQRFVRTGDTPEHYRVITFMGRVILSHMSIAADKTPIYAPTKTTNVTAKALSNNGARVQKMVADDEVLELAIQASKAFPDCALQAHDLIRERETGKIYSLEMNSGNVWCFSGSLNQHLRDAFGVENMIAQYGVFDIVAEEMAREARNMLL